MRADVESVVFQIRESIIQIKFLNQELCKSEGNKLLSSRKLGQFIVFLNLSKQLFGLIAIELFNKYKYSYFRIGNNLQTEGSNQQHTFKSVKDKYNLSNFIEETLFRIMNFFYYKVALIVNKE